MYSSLSSHFTCMPNVWLAASGRSVRAAGWSRTKRMKMKTPCCRWKGKKKKSRLANNANCRWFCIFLLQSLSRSWSWAALTPADSGIWGTEQDAEAQMSQGRFGAKQEQVFRLLVTSSCLRAKVLCFPVLATELFFFLLQSFDCIVIIYGPQVWLICWFLLTRSFKRTPNFFTYISP